MSDFRVGSGPFFERGIDSITFKASESAKGLPDPHELAPSEQGVRPLLDQLLALPNIESFLDEATRPELEDRDLLLPGRFRQSMDRVIGALSQAADQLQGQDPDGVRLLNRASRLLCEEVALRDLLQMYRSVLYQG